MTSTVFTDYTTPIVASWLNDVNNNIYKSDGTKYLPPTFSQDFTVSPTGRISLAATADVRSYGAVGDGVIDDTSAILAAANALGAAGGRVVVPNGARCRIASNLSVPANVTIAGPYEAVGTPGSNSSTEYGSVGGALLLSSSATITLASNSALSGLLIYRYGMTFPAASASAFAGTAVTISGDDASVRGCMILGFNKAILSSSGQRLIIVDVRIDCQNGVDLSGCYDVPYLERVHCWPFATIATYAANTADKTVLTRTGTAFYLHDIADWAKVSHCFSYGYVYGFDFNNVNTPTIVSCSADGPSGSDIVTNCRGFQIRGTTGDAKVIACQAASQVIAFYLDTGSSYAGSLTDCVAWAGSTHGIFIGAGDWNIKGGGVYSVTNGISYTNAASTTLVHGLRVGASVTVPINNTATSNISKLQLREINWSSTSAGSSPVGGSGTLVAESLASAMPLALPARGDVFNVTGTANFSSITGGFAGRAVSLIFQGVLTVVHGTGDVNSVRLSGASNFTTAAGYVLRIQHNGTQWYEISRSA